jgi:adenine deaminase
MDGGVAMVQDGKILGDLAFSVGGLITDEMRGENNPMDWKA